MIAPLKTMPSTLRRLATALAAASALLASAAHGLVLPYHEVDSHHFASQTADVRVVLARIAVERLDRLPGDPAGGLWWVEADLVLRNEIRGDVVLDLFVPDEAEFTEDSGLWIDGVAQPGEESRLHADPAYPGLDFDHGRIYTVPMAGERVATMRVARIVRGNVDQYGQITVTLDTHLLGAPWVGEIDDASVAFRFDERPIGLMATLNAGSIYDEPEAGAVWFPRLWEPAIPFQLSYVSPWSALLLAATVEECPSPWDVVRGMTEGNLNATFTHLATFDEITLRFCAGLPHVLHGGPLTSTAARDQLGAIDLGRYIPGPARGPLYRANPRFEESFLTEVEAIYRRTLLSVVTPVGGASVGIPDAAPSGVPGGAAVVPFVVE